MTYRNSETHIGFKSTFVSPEEVFQSLNGILGAAVTGALANCAAFGNHLIQCWVVQFTLTACLLECGFEDCTD